VSRAQRAQLEAQLEEVSGKLSDARADRKESDYETKAAEAVAQMKRMFPGESCATPLVGKPRRGGGGEHSGGLVAWFCGKKGLEG
jgi:hypothetical protein